MRHCMESLRLRGQLAAILTFGDVFGYQCHRMEKFRNGYNRMMMAEKAMMMT